MVKAIEEGRRWAGKKEGIITKTRNYHREIGQADELDSAPWCASFVNFCFKSVGTPFEKSRSSQFACTSKKFVKIDKPVYGALMVLRNYRKDTGAFDGTGHVTFVYGRADNATIVGLGGNQGDMIRASRYRTSGPSSEFKLHGKKMQQKFYAFYVPATYAEFAKREPDLPTVDPDTVNRELLGNRVSGTAANENTR
jgi:uncharacterized protein (TIGR02594 family)